MKVIALQGRGNSGKSTTLKILISMILEHIDKCNDKIKKIYLEKSVNGNDLNCIVEYFGKTTAITTMGDVDTELNDWFDEVESKYGKAYIYICACHTRGKTLDFLIDRFGNENVILCGKSYISLVETKDVQEKNDVFIIKEQINANASSAIELFKILNSLV